MKTLRRLLFLFPIVLACVSTNANAWFFFFLPGSVTSKIGDALSGSEGDSCVKTTAKVGDTINSPTGNSATVKSLSGTSSRCQDPNLPIRALLTFNYSFSSKAGMDIPEGFEQKPLTDMQRYQGFLLKAEHPVKRLNFMVSSQPRTPATEAAALARSIATRMMAAIDDAKGSREEELSIRGMHALRFEVEGKNKGLFGARFTYVVTLLEGSQEMIVVNAWAPTKDDFEKERNELRQLAFRVEGLSSNDAATLAPATAASALVPTANPAQLDVAAPTAALPASASEAPPPASAPQSGLAAQAAKIAAPASSGDSVPNKLRELDKLYRDGILTQKEYESKKQELLKAL